MAAKKSILHFVTPLKNVSPFDVNMAADAGFDVVVPYSDVDVKEVAGLVQDAIFSRAPQDGRRVTARVREPMSPTPMNPRAVSMRMPMPSEMFMAVVSAR